MFAMFKQLFTMVSTYLIAIGKVGTACNNLGDWAVESSAAFVDEARSQRAIALLQFKAAEELQVKTLTKASKVTIAAQ